MCYFTSYTQQNLVSNGSFEEYYSCPIANDLHDGELEKCKYWWKPTKGTSDYFNRCNNGVVSVPNNFWGYQEPYQGDGYVGLVPVCWFSDGSLCSFEYIQTKLKQPLKPCTIYRFRMRVCLAEDVTHSIGKLGAVVTNDSFYFDNEDIINLAPTVFNKNGNLGDSIGWTLIEETFIADGKEEFLTIGYFFSNLLEDTVFIQDYNVGTFAPYYYIDDVSVHEVGKVEECEYVIPNTFTPNNDGINDVWEFTSSFEGEIQIFNRWGVIVYNALGTDFKWKGEGLVDGVYFYKFITSKNIKTGFIHLMR